MSAHTPAAGWPQPYPQMDAAPYWAALQEKRLTFQRCEECRQAVWPAHSFCPDCGTRSLKWEDSKGRGRIYSFSTIMRGPTPLFQSIVPYTVGFVEMDEGYFLFTQFEGAPETLAIGGEVEARFIERGGQTLPVFAAAG